MTALRLTMRPLSGGNLLKLSKLSRVTVAQSTSYPPQDELAAAAEQMELRCVLAVVRHGDRTPKQKMKMTVTQVHPVRFCSVIDSLVEPPETEVAACQ